jgi:hypothetical protein
MWSFIFEFEALTLKQPLAYYDYDVNPNLNSQKVSVPFFACGHLHLGTGEL